MNNKRVLYIVMVCIFVSVAALIVFLANSATPNAISGLENCTKDINQNVKSETEDYVYSTIKNANDYNDVESLDYYNPVVREGSCKLLSDQATNDYDGNYLRVKNSTMILDIPEAKQSWRLTFSWVSGDNTNTDLGEPTAECLPIEDLKYGDFNCEDIMNLKNYGTVNYDPILEFMPYDGQGFNLSYDPDTRTVSVDIEVPESQKDNQNLINNNKSAVERWFTRNNLSIGSYTVQYRTVVTYE